MPPAACGTAIVEPFTHPCPGSLRSHCRGILRQCVPKHRASPTERRHTGISNTEPVSFNRSDPDWRVPQSVGHIGQPTQYAQLRTTNPTSRLRAEAAGYPLLTTGGGGGVLPLPTKHPPRLREQMTKANARDIFLMVPSFDSFLIDGHKVTSASAPLVHGSHTPIGFVFVAQGCGGRDCKIRYDASGSSSAGWQCQGGPRV
jgi:hypothetical protein